MGTTNIVPPKVAGQMFHMKFDGNLIDSDMWNMDGIRRLTNSLTGAFVTGVFGQGQAASFNDSPVEVGTEDCTWSTCAGGNCCGGSSKSGGPAGGNVWLLSEAKYNLSVEMWIYPTSDPSDNINRTLLAKHTSSTGGYAMQLKRVNSEYRVSIQANFAYGGPDTVSGGTWDVTASSCNGLRGAYSSVAIVPNVWTHVAASFDYQGDNADLSNYDPSQGKFRVYVNGEDVTWSDGPGSSCYTQPQSPSDTTAEDLAYGFEYQEWMTPQSEVGMRYGSSRCGGWCGNSLSIGGYNWSSIGNFQGYIDEVKVWYVTKDADYFGSAIPPFIASVQGQSGYDKLHVQFSEPVYSGTDGTGALGTSDLSLLSDGRTFTISHNEGDNFAILTLDSPLDNDTDLNVDTLAAVSGQIFDSFGQIAADANNIVTITPMQSVQITGVQGVEARNELWVTFSGGAYTDVGLTGSLIASDFDLVLSDNTRTIDSVSHSVGSSTATLFLDSNLDANDIDAITGDDTLAVAPVEVYSAYTNPVTGASGAIVGIETTDIIGAPQPSITSVTGAVNYNKLTVGFSEGVYTTLGLSGALVASDFTITDADNGRTIDSVSHVAGSNTAEFTLSSALDSITDINVDTIEAKLGEVYNSNDIPMDTTPVVITELTTPIISTAEGIVGSDQVKVTFVAPAYANDDATGALVAGDFLHTDTNAGFGAGSITTVSHGAGDSVAYLTMNTTLTAEDLNASTGDTVAAFGGSIFFADGTLGGTVPVMFTAQAVPTLVSVTGITGYNKLEATFSEGVWTGAGMVGGLVATDFAIVDSDNGRTISSVSHTAGDAVAILTLSSAIDATADIDTDTVNAVASGVYNNLSNIVGTTAVTVTRMPGASLQGAEGFVGGTDLYVTFSEGVSSDQVNPVAITAGSFVVSGVSASSITTIDHVGGARTAIFTMNAAMDAGDPGVATLAATGGSVWNQAGYPMGTETLTMSAQVPPAIVAVEGAVGHDILSVRFDQVVYGNTGGDPDDNLLAADFNFIDDDGRTIISVDHSPGFEQYKSAEDYAFVKLSSPLTALDFNHAGTTIAPTTIYNFLGAPAATTPFQITGVPVTTIESVTGAVGSDKLEVVFKHPVATSPGMTGSLVPSDFILTDTNGDNTRTITDVTHRPGNLTATLTISKALIAADVNADTIGAALAEIYNNFDYPVPTTAVPITVRYGGPRIKIVTGRPREKSILVEFDGPVYANANMTGDLQIADFTYIEVRYTENGLVGNPSPNTINNVWHNAGDDYAVLTFQYKRCHKYQSTDCPGTISTADYSGDILADRIAPAADSIFSASGAPSDTSSKIMLIGTRPNIESIEGVVGSDRLYMQFNERAWGDRDASVNPIVPADFSYVSNSGRTILNVIHNPGDDFAVLVMSAVTVEGDFGVDSFVPTSWVSFFSGYNYGFHKGAFRFKYLTRGPKPYITSVTGVAGTDLLSVHFSEGVGGLNGPLQKTDFVLTVGDANSNNARLISSVVQHVNGDDIAIIQTDAATAVSGDLNEDTITAGADLKSFTMGYPLDTTPVTISGDATILSAAEGSTSVATVLAHFSGPVYSANDRTGNLAASDFTLTDIDDGLGGTDDINPRTITAVTHSAGESTALLTIDAVMKPLDVDNDTLAPASGAIFDELGQALAETPVVISSVEGPYITRVEGAVGQDKLQVNFSVGVYTDTIASAGAGGRGGVGVDDFVLTDSDNSRTITNVEHYKGSAAAILTLSSALDRDSDVGVDMLAARPSEIFAASDDAMRTTPVVIIGNGCPPAGFRLDFNEAAGSATVTDTTGLVVGDVFDPVYSIKGDGYFTGDPAQQVQTFIDFSRNNYCFKTPRAYTIETKVYFADVEIDYGDVYPLNGIDDDYDAGDGFSRLPEFDPTTPDGKNVTNVTLFHRHNVIDFITTHNNWGGSHTADRKDKTIWFLRHNVKEKVACDGTLPGNTVESSPGNAEEWTSDFDTYPILSGHWYTMRVVFNTDKGQTSFDYFTRDDGTDGLGAGKLWDGYINISRTPEAGVAGDCVWQTNPGSEVLDENVGFAIGDNMVHNDYYDAMPNADDMPGNVWTPWLMGKMDWFVFKPIADYSNVDDIPWSGNTLPVASAGADAYAALGLAYGLDGSASNDTDGDPLQFTWTIEPTISATVSAATQANPVNITATAHGFADGDKVYITGITGMTEINGRSFTIALVDANNFTLTGEDGTSHTAYSSGGTAETGKPTGSTAALTDSSVESPSFTPDLEGVYTFKLVVDDGFGGTATDYAYITAETPPVADAGVDLQRDVSDLVTLDGTGSSDPEADPITYNWAFTSKPASSTATLTNPTTDSPSFTADVQGYYVIELIVDDGKVSSADTVTVRAGNIPDADAGNDQNVTTGTLVTLDGSVSSDPDLDPITYSWTFAVIPVGSAATLSGATTVALTFTPDLDGVYSIQLIVNDGAFDSAPSAVFITAAP